MTDSYHFESVPKFRVGGVYRDQGGNINRIEEPADSIGAVRVFMLDDDGFGYGGEHTLSDGLFIVEAHNPENMYHLVPGELVERDGEWVPADSIGPFPSGATLKTSGDKIVGRVEAQPAQLFGDWLSEQMAAQAKKAVPKRAPLPNSDEWRGIGHKAHDTFGADFIVTKGAEPTSPLYASPTTDSAYPAIAGLLRG